MDYKEIKEQVSNYNLLYVEDDKTIQDLYSELFGMLFNNVTVANDGLEGLTLYQKNNYDLVITDIRMLIMDGCEMMLKIREINPDQKIIAVSATRSKDIVESIKFDAWEEKPMNMEVLLNTIVNVIRY
jgi:CheY-like chemotaxis protein